MRITKKFAGASCIGKQVFHPCENNESNNTIRVEGEAELVKLEKLFLARLYSKAATLLDRQNHQLQREQIMSQAPRTPAQSPSGRGIKHKQNPTIAEADNNSTLLNHATKSTLPDGSPESESSTNTSTDCGNTSIGGVSFSSSGSLSYQQQTGVFQKNKRIMSAPDLTQLSILATTAAPSSSSYAGENNSIDDPYSSIARLGVAGSADDSALSGAYFSSGSTGIASSHSSGLNSSSFRKSPVKGTKTKNILMSSSGGLHKSGVVRGAIRGQYKKSHSAMDLVNYEKLAADDRAAGEWSVWCRVCVD